MCACVQLWLIRWLYSYQRSMQTCVYDLLLECSQYTPHLMSCGRHEIQIMWRSIFVSQRGTGQSINSKINIQVKQTKSARLPHSKSGYSGRYGPFSCRAATDTHSCTAYTHTQPHIYCVLLHLFCVYVCCLPQNTEMCLQYRPAAALIVKVNVKFIYVWKTAKNSIQFNFEIFILSAPFVDVFCCFSNAKKTHCTQSSEV